jgi:hypothetical protein
MLALVSDAGLTLAGQGSAYWQGDYRTALEMNPIAYPLLAHHPATFAVYVMAWGIALCFAILWCPPRLAPVISFAACFGHAFAAAAWLWRAGICGALVSLVWLLAASRVLALSWKQSGVEQEVV